MNNSHDREWHFFLSSRSRHTRCYRDWSSDVCSSDLTVERTIPRIREFLEKGGTIIAIGSSAANLASALKLPVEDQLVENGAPLPRTKFYVPGSLLTARVDTQHPLGAGMAERTDFFFENSPVFKLAPNAE